MPPTSGPFAELLRRAFLGERLLFLAYNNAEAERLLREHTIDVRPRVWHPIVDANHGDTGGAFYVATIEDVDHGRLRGFRYDDWICGEGVRLTPEEARDLQWGLVPKLVEPAPPAPPPDEAIFAARVRALRGG
jgi:hypothetical protein